MDTEKREKQREYQKAWYLKNREKELAKRKAIAALPKNREVKRKASLEHYHKNKELYQERHKEYYAKNKEERLAYNRAYNAANPALMMLNRARRRASTKGLMFTIDLNDIIIPEYCPILLHKLVPSSGPRYNSPSLDRIISPLGYTKGNIQVISNRANCMKQDASPEELVLFAKWVKCTYPELYGMD